MSKQVRFRDFQVMAHAPYVAAEEEAFNEILFSIYEPVRLWLKECTVKAPFSKIVISLSDDTISAPWHGNVTNAIGICQVTEAVGVPTLRQNIGDHAWVFGRVLYALECVARHTEWRSLELEHFITTLSQQALPFVHFFERLTHVARITGVKCTPWFSTRPGENKIGVRLVLKDGAERDVTVRSEPDSLFLEYSFPLAKSAIRGQAFVLLDKAGKVLASVPIDKAGD
jgi:hypothetical protein